MKSYIKQIIVVLAIFVAAATAKAVTLSSAAGVTAASPAPKPTAPVWGKLVMSGNTVSCYYALGSATPKTWTAIGSPQTIGFLNNPLLVGIFITSHNVAAVSSGTIDNVSITPSPKYRLQDGDIGSPKLMGSANPINGVWTLAGSGSDIWGTSDQCNFQPWLVWGDCTVICRVTSISAGNVWQKIGIMIRDGYNSGSDFALFCASNGGGNSFQYRLDFNVNPDGATVATLVAPATTITGTAVGVNPTGSSSLFYTLRP